MTRIWNRFRKQSDAMLKRINESQILTGQLVHIILTLIIIWETDIILTRNKNNHIDRPILSIHKTQ